MGENDAEAEVGEGSENVGFVTEVDKAESKEPGPVDKETPGEGNGEENGLVEDDYEDEPESSSLENSEDD